MHDACTYTGISLFSLFHIDAKASELPLQCNGNSDVKTMIYLYTNDYILVRLQCTIET